MLSHNLRLVLRYVHSHKAQGVGRTILWPYLAAIYHFAGFASVVECLLLWP